jgi:UDP-N-acetylmuramate dehydrogenase
LVSVASDGAGDLPTGTCRRAPDPRRHAREGTLPLRARKDAEERLRETLGDRLLTREPMRHHTTLRIGGPADYFYAAATPDDLVAALRAAYEAGMPAFLLGGGSNLLVSDEGVRGLVVRDACSRIEFDGTAVHVEAGADFMEFIYACRDRELAGLEFAAGIPGTVGGALCGNAGCYGQDIGSFVVECTVATLDGAVVETVPASWLRFGYRDSRLKREPRVILSCLLQLRRGERDQIQRVIAEKLEIRRVKHPQWRVEPTAGSYFKNLPPDFRMPGGVESPGTHRIAAGQLLDQCGVRGLRVGDALVFPKHANIIVNAGHATAREVLELAEVMKARVRQRFGVELEEEVMFLGERPRLEAASGP